MDGCGVMLICYAFFPDETRDYEGTEEEVIARILAGIAENRKAGPVGKWAARMIAAEFPYSEPPH